MFDAGYLLILSSLVGPLPWDFNASHRPPAGSGGTCCSPSLCWPWVTRVIWICVCWPCRCLPMIGFGALCTAITVTRVYPLLQVAHHCLGVRTGDGP